MLQLVTNQLLFSYADIAQCGRAQRILRCGSIPSIGDKVCIKLVSIRRLRANNLVVDLGFAKNADFTGLNIDSVNEIVETLAVYFRDYGLLKPIGFIGNGLIRNPDFVKKDPTVLAWTEGIDYEGASVSAEALCFVRFDEIEAGFLIAHEMCHVMDSNFGLAISSSPKIKAMFGADASELLADAWAEYKTLPKPSKTAVAVGRFVENFYKKTR